MAKEPQAEGGAEARKPVSQEELQAAFSGPALNANKVYSSVMPAGIRLSFMEHHPEEVPPTYRTAVLLSIGDAIALKNLLVRQLAQFEEMLEQAEQGTSEQNG